MLIRFCLYGFLKNQRYFEPYFMLGLLSHELSFFGIGLLLACRSLTLNALEIPSGAIADLWGRRRCMILSFVAYIISFVLFAVAPNAGFLIPAMVLFGIGDSFRTGTHKAMIFEWLRLQGREQERTAIYGQTRSWSQYGSAVSAVLSAGFVLVTGDFRSVFLFAIIPYLINILNFIGYPPELDGARSRQLPAWELGGVVRSLQSALRQAWEIAGVRKLIAESMAWEGVFNAIHDYLQPALLILVLVRWNTGTDVSAITPAAAAQSPVSVIVIAATYAVISALGGIASRRSHRLSMTVGSDDKAARVLWWCNLSLYCLLGLSDAFGLMGWVVLAFVGQAILQNVWRPILISRFDEYSDPQWGATVLSIESQAQRIATLVVAPVVGLCIDFVGVHHWPGRFWPIAVVGIGAILPMLKRQRAV